MPIRHNSAKRKNKWITPLILKELSIHICAHRDLAYQVLTAVGTKTINGQKLKEIPLESSADNSKLNNSTSTQILSILPITFFGLFTINFTQHEQWFCSKPTRIDIRMVQGKGIAKIFSSMEESIQLSPAGDCMELSYYIKYSLKGHFFSYILGKLLAFLFLKSWMQYHIRIMKWAIESRAERSRVYPQSAACIFSEDLKA